MVNDLTTLNGSLQELIDKILENLETEGVITSFDPSTGLLGLADEILNIEGGGGNCIVEYPNLGTEFNYVNYSEGLIFNFPSRITSLGARCFRYCDGLTEITIPSHITTLGTSCFDGCTQLETVNLNNNITSIPTQCFYGCTALQEITLPNSLLTIGQSAFYSCRNLEEISIPSTVTTINSYAFTGCSALEKVTLSSNITNIPMYCFDGCASLNDIEIPSNVTTFSSTCFRNCSSLKSINIPVGTTTLAVYAFQNCTSLLSVNIPSTVTSISTQCFNGCTSLLGYEFNWTESGNILSYSSANMPLPENAKIIVPDGTTTLYTAKSYPSSAIVEKSNVVYEFIDMTESNINRWGDIEIKLRLIHGVSVVDDATVTLTGSDNSTRTGTTDDDGIVTFNISNVHEDVEYTASYGNVSCTIEITYKPYLLYDECNDAEGLSNYSTPLIFDGFTEVASGMSLSSSEDYYIISHNNAKYLYYPIDVLDGKDNFTFTCKIKLNNGTSGTYAPCVGLCVTENDTTVNSEFIGRRWYSTAYAYAYAGTIKNNTISQSSSSNVTIGSAAWMVLEVVFDDSNQYVAKWKKEDGTVLKTYTGTVTSSKADRHYGIVLYANSLNYAGHIKGIIVDSNE